MVHGFADARFAAAREAFASNFSEDREIGASVCATVDGETVIDLWGGWADAARTQPWQRGTIVNVFSTTKTMTALTALLLADRGDLDLAAPVAESWPEFAANGKEHVTTAQLLSHSAGLPGWREPFGPDDATDWGKATRLLAAQAPLWEPGTASGYHAYTHGFLVGEVVRRVTGRSPGTVFRQEIAGPLDADFRIGLPESEDHRVAELAQPPGPAPEAGAVEMAEIPSIAFRDMQADGRRAWRMDVAQTRTRAWRGAEIPSVNGHGNARSIAGIHAVLANGGVARGRRILSEAGSRRVLEPQIEGPDLVMRGIGVCFGLGFALAPCPLLPVAPPNPNTVFWGGGGGSLAVIDLDARTSFAYAMNRMDRAMLGDERSFRVLRAFWQALA
ncbi:serine hydrolase domain-containing protein [Inquilinus limosus]|uniref:serine hydrolase domain-containing protein n=1 Tax=Inquilinus limosus TaxID=171674 RepID=UPI000B48AF19|nr:serine hydrolase domain-containing protein [Inquilinus limosus]